MGPEIIFVIPFVVLIAYVIYQFVMHNREMEAWIDHLHKTRKFKVVEKDNLEYVVPNPQQVTSQD